MEADQLKNFISQALAEDIGDGDHTSLACIPESSRSTAELLIKDIGVVAGVEVATQIFKYLDPDMLMTVHYADGEDVTHGNIVFAVECNTLALLSAERLVLNTMQRMSGIATLSSRFAVEIEGMDVKVLDTRKTTPLIRFLEKEAVRIGGCENYRFGLFDWIMIKDNHIDACGGIQQAIDSVHAYFERKNLNLGITIEVRNLVELYEVLRRGGVDRIMLDNFDLPIMEEAVKIIDGAFESEASGGVTLNTVRMIAETGVNYVSVGALTHSGGSLDMSLNIVKPV
jgi:nicotinate-nucleotide pyrophosphorylase (carboxylating)